VIKFVSDMGQVGGFLRVLHDITEIVLKVALNTIKQTNIHILGNVTMTQFITNMTHYMKRNKGGQTQLSIMIIRFTYV
jgi:hypothetical protein